MLGGDGARARDPGIGLAEGLAKPVDLVTRRAAQHRVAGRRELCGEIAIARPE